jgi:Conserved protein/domain typically associated with flavoprotein oxygenases, DIM6/NTAB family
MKQNSHAGFMAKTENGMTFYNTRDMDKNALFKIKYGLYVLTTSYDNKDNGCIINTVMQVTDSPLRIAITVNKKNLTHDLILNSSEFNLSCLTKETPFSVFEHFGFQSGKDDNKFAECNEECRLANHVLYIPKYTNACIAAHVVKVVDLETHSLFIADVTDSKILSEEAETVDYEYYLKNIKPHPSINEGKKGWRCKICGYVYEGEDIPEDFICPWCKHGVADFEKTGF